MTTSLEGKRSDNLSHCTNKFLNRQVNKAVLITGFSYYYNNEGIAVMQNASVSLQYGSDELIELSGISYIKSCLIKSF